MGSTAWKSTCIACWLLAASSLLATDPSDSLSDSLRPVTQILSGEKQTFELSGRAAVPIDGNEQIIEFAFVRFSKDEFNLRIAHPDYAVVIERRLEETRFGLPKHGVVFKGSGTVPLEDSLAPDGFLTRILGPGSAVSLIAPVLFQNDPQVLADLVIGLASLKRDSNGTSPAASRWIDTKGRTLEFLPESFVRVKDNDFSLEFSLVDSKLDANQSSLSSDWKTIPLERSELERTLTRGLRRALEILSPSEMLKSPNEKSKKVDHGELRWIEGQRVALLQGTPSEVGKAHGELLQKEAQRCIDSVLYTFGTAETIRSGKWFRSELQSAYAQLEPHIPADHQAEIASMAASLEMPPDLLKALNVFPEMFHCSGFALFGKATLDGKLIHGRVLDYMTTIGLQDSATTFIVSIDGKIPFANVGYAGFIGSVSGMNADAVSLGEMGGRGEGKWDGVPMATLMRRALEECKSVEEVCELWSSSPRTCEYYYVFADGRTNRAVGVAATPEAIEFILPGQTDPRLGEGIPDAVVLSAGDRLQTLRTRVKENYGRIDVTLGQWLMSRPVAMKSNLHNVLFVPADGVLYVANADHEKPAAERPYVKIDLKALLSELEASK